MSSLSYTIAAPLVTSRTSPTAPERSVTSIAAMPYVGVWKREPKPDTPDELTKVPYNPRTGRKALPNKTGTFGTRQQAETALASGEYAGLCFLIADDLGVTAGDLDHIVPEDRAFDETAIPADVRRLIRVANTYASWSPSGTGIRLYFAAVVPGYKTRTPVNAPIHAEAYSRARFMTETFRRISGTPDTFTTDPGDLAAWITLLGFEHNAPAVRTTLAVAPSLTLDDADVIERLRRTSDPRFSRLFDAGDLTEHDGDASRADLALMNLIAWASGDPAQTERLFDASALGQRAKWTGRPDYRASTISKAFDGRTSYYQPTGSALPEPRREPEHEPDPGDCAALRAELQRERERRRAAEADTSMAIALMLNPHVKESEKRATVAASTLALRGRPDAEGYVLLRPGEIANDWRESSKTGQNQAPLNNDGSRIRMARGSVKATLDTLTAGDFLDATPEAHEVRPKGRDPYVETAWRVRRPVSIAAALAPLATFNPETPVTRLPRTLTCPECGEAHPTVVQTVRRVTCTGCGAVTETLSTPKVVQPIIDISPEDDRSEKISDAYAPAATITNHMEAVPRSERFSNVYPPVVLTSEKLSDPSPAAPPSPAPLPIRPTDLDARFTANGWN